MALNVHSIGPFRQFAPTRRSLNTVLVLFAALSLNSLASAQQNPPGATGGQQAPRQIATLAVVNGQPISREQLAQETMRRFGTDVLQDIVNKVLVSTECEKQGIVITEKDINDEIAGEAEKLGWSADRWLNVISSNKDLSIDQIKNDYVWNKLALRRLVADSIRITKEELDEQTEFEFGAQVQVRQIVLETAAKAQQILEAAKANPEDFERLAKQNSIDPNSASMGGLLPPIRLNSGLPQFEEVAFSLQPGQISDVVPVADKFIIMRCQRIFPAEILTAEQLTSVHDRLVEKITNQKMGDAAVDLFARIQKTAEIQNILNRPELSQEMPGIAAVVNGLKIPKQHVAEECIVRYGKDMLETEINRTLLRQALQQIGLEVTQEDISGEIQRAAKSIGHVNSDGTVNVDRWLKFVTGNDLSKVDFYIEDEVWPTVATKKLVEKGVSVSPEDLQKGYEANFGPRVEVLVVVTTDHRQALKVWNMASANSTADYFGKLANQYSVEPASKNNFGQVPPIQQHGGRAELEKEAFALKAGEISKVVQVGEHWVIMYCQGRTQPVVTEFEAVKDEIERNILEKKMRLAMYEKFQQIREDAQIDNFLMGTSQTGKPAVQAARQATTRRR